MAIGFDPANLDDVRLMDIRDRWISPVWMLLFAVATLGFAAYRLRVRNDGPGDAG